MPIYIANNKELLWHLCNLDQAKFLRMQCGIFISHSRAKHTVNDSGEQFLTVVPYIFKVVLITVRFPATPIFQFRNCRLVRMGANEARNGSTERVAGKRVEIITKITQQLFQLFIEHGFCQIFWRSESETGFSGSKIPSLIALKRTLSGGFMFFVMFCYVIFVYGLRAVPADFCS